MSGSCKVVKEFSAECLAVAKSKGISEGVLAKAVVESVKGKIKNTTTRYKGKLAVFQNELKPLSKNSGLLFAVIKDKSIDGKLRIRCVLCEQLSFIGLENRDLGSFYRHLDQQHFGIASQIRSYFSKVEDLFLGVDTNLLLSSETNNLN